MKECRVVSGRYQGRNGYGEVSKYNTVMFYPNDGMGPYRVCLMANEVEFF